MHACTQQSKHAHRVLFLPVYHLSSIALCRDTSTISPIIRMVKTHCGQVDKNKEQTQVFQNHFHCRNGCLYLILSHDHRPTWELTCTCPVIFLVFSTHPKQVLPIQMMDAVFLWVKWWVRWQVELSNHWIHRSYAMYYECFNQGVSYPFNTN